MHPQPAVSLAEEVWQGLSDRVQKRIPAMALYDSVGTALFEAITALPEYGLTRADVRLLRQAAPEVASVTGAGTVVELGSGPGTKTRILLSAFPRQIVYRPIDVSGTALERCRTELSGFDVHPVEAEFLRGLDRATAQRDGRPLLLLFLGSNIGNFERRFIPPFLAQIARQLRAGDTFLLGADLVKGVDRLLLAYDDPAGVTAAFNRYLLSRLNWEFEADFDVRSWEHEVRWNAGERRIEMHLRAARPMSVRVRAFDLQLRAAAGETIWTESSHKFETGELTAIAAQYGLETLRCWTDAEWPFSEILFRRL